MSLNRWAQPGAAMQAGSLALFRFGSILQESYSTLIIDRSRQP